ncbi:MAG TPA: phosphoribosylamine--glycine ligase [Candidatus Moranbacteria bacterium]|nr:phosphoribosylamine--glycine ligase [Candidatus Moranbacteria bacterium]HSA08589.1 phosphoribosylamine--glycine ligase [Candidatus Moranbacteria bacterium]
MKERKRILVIGSGGREYSMVGKLAQSPLVDKIYCAPGNDEMGRIPKTTPISDITAKNVLGLRNFALENDVGCIVAGPEDPLVLGASDDFEAAGLNSLGPKGAAARLEGSKVRAKEFMKRHKIPTAPFIVLENAVKAKDYFSGTLTEFGKPKKFPLVIKMDGLAAGKGVRVCYDLVAAIEFLDDILAGKFGEAGNGKIIIEDCLKGEEASYIVIIDKNGNFISLASSQDHKLSENDDYDGPRPKRNTGGMGAYSPAPVVTDAVEKKVRRIVRKVINGMKKEKCPFTGFLYIGLMIKDGKINVLEFNVRSGDPETQPILARMKSDFAELIMAALDGALDKFKIEWDDVPAVTVALTAEGYSVGKPRKGDVITGIEDAEKTGAIISFAGVKRNKKGELITNGGRVLYVTAKGDFPGDFTGAIEKVYEAVGMIHFDGMHYRTDIAKKAINRAAA